MKKIILVALLCLPTVLFAQKVNYSVQGVLSKQNRPLKMYMICQTEEGGIIDSVILNKGKFSFTGSLKAPCAASLIVDQYGIGIRRLLGSDSDKNNDALPLYIEGGNIGIEGTDLIRNATIKNSQVSVDYQQFLQALAVTRQRVNKLTTQAGKVSNMTPQEQTKIQLQYDSIRIDQRIVFVDFIKQHTRSMISLDALKALGGDSPDANEIEPLFKTLAPAIQNSTAGKSYGALLHQLKVTAIGSIAPNFSQNDVNGKPVTLASFRGKYVLVDFWASWCGPCRQENPNVVKAFNRFKSKNFTVLGVSLDRSKNSWLDAIKKDQLDWTQVSDLKGWQNEVAQLYNIRAIPQNILLDPSGRIIDKNLRDEVLISKLEALFGSGGSK